MATTREQVKNLPRAYVATTDLAEGDIVEHHGMVLRLGAKQTRVDAPGAVCFQGEILNRAELAADAKADSARGICNSSARFILGQTSRDNVWHVQGNAGPRWIRLG